MNSWIQISKLFSYFSTAHSLMQLWYCWQWSLSWISFFSFWNSPYFCFSSPRDPSLYFPCFLFPSKGKCGWTLTFSQHAQSLRGFPSSFHVEKCLEFLISRPDLFFGLWTQYLLEISTWISHWHINMSKSILVLALPLKSDSPTVLLISVQDINII